ncbi:extracellular solute-binding protein (family 3) [Marinimicrobium koreense]|uniref:Extracellular solute-binding protein (Family 3) n=1 Tax=Marinimicrobium koreense TaxID=306545 RepID=A0A3N1NFC5_9GAMM|nr:transporter substrate-binding domain-containing protein [Marinimicrobium koreense]ROQ18594.1 extracellular solute-binding protein (family 3) [Marinimicrobium koreense]
MPDYRATGRACASRWLSLPALWLTINLAPLANEPSCTLHDGKDVPSVQLPLRHEARHEHRGYYEGLLQLALDKFETEYGPCHVTVPESYKPQVRRYLDLERKTGADIIDATATPERSERFRAIPVPLLKGLMGYRLFFIRESDKEAFSNIQSLDDLRAFRAGQGESWFDVTLLKAHDIPVVTAPKYESLFRMLQAERFDFFPRGAQEILDEQDNFDTEGLIIEPDLLLAYPAPVYFYVHKDNVALADRVETGLRRAVNDGSFDQYYYSHPMVRKVFTELNLFERTTLYLCHPHHRDPDLLQQADTWVRPWPKRLCDNAGIPTLD